VDPSVSEALFDDEVEGLRAMAVFSKGSWKVISAEFPDLVVELPHQTGVQRRFRFRCDDWDERPPSVKSGDASGNELPQQPSGNLWMQLNTGWGLCAPGTREYHAHHAENPWPSHRGTMSLRAIVIDLAARYRKASA
jgi:hypothetical protein